MRPVLVTVAALLFAGTLTAAPDDLENAFQSLKEAEAKKDAALVKKLAAETCALARKAKEAPAPEEAAEKEYWAQRVAFARDVEAHTEYALYAVAVASPAETAVDLLSALEELNPKSKYLDDAYGRYFLALNQCGAAAKIVPIAEKALVNLPDNEDLLLVLADAALNRKQSDRAHGYAEKLLVVLAKHPRPEGLPPAEWERKRTAALGRAAWISGIVHSEKNQFYDADRDLRVALPLVKGNESMLAAALFYLGVANYQIGVLTRNRAQVSEAAKFSEQASAIKGPLQYQAWKNTQAMKNEILKMR